MTKEQIFAAVRGILVLLGTYLVGINVFGVPVDETVWQEILGAGMVVASFIWSFTSKALTIEIVQSTVLKVVMVGGSLLVSSGKLTGEKLTAIVGLITAVLPILYSFLSKKKSQDIAEGTIPVSKLAK